MQNKAKARFRFKSEAPAFVPTLANLIGSNRTKFYQRCVEPEIEWMLG